MLACYNGAMSSKIDVHGSRAVVVLCNPEDSCNVGAVCRAMKTMSVKELRIVGEKTAYNTESVARLAVHSFDIFENANFFNNLKDALKDCTWTIGTTRRRGKKRKDWLMLPEECAEKASKMPQQSIIALVFGNERTGLTDEELALCNSGVIIPSDAEQGSLNLSHAVQVMCYTFYRAKKFTSQGYLPITQERAGKTVDLITNKLEELGFFKIAGKSDMQNFWQSILSRASLSEGEAAYLEKTFCKIAGLAHKEE